MALFSSLKNYLKGRKSLQYAKILNGMAPVFTSFGTDVYASDLTKGAVRCIAGEVSKLSPRHILTDAGTGLQKQVNSDINRLLRFAPNPYMTTSDFLSKIVFLREKYLNCYIYPAYEKIPLKDGKHKRKYTGFYPLNPMGTEYLEDDRGILWVKFTFGSGYSYTMKYADIIHWRKDYFENEFCGGDINGNPDTEAERKLLETDHTITEGMEKATKLSMGARGILKMNTMLTDETQEQEREKFEEKLASSRSGIMVADLKSDYIPLKIDPKVIDKDTVELIETRILANRGVSIGIYNGDFNEEQYQAFYEKTLEPLIVSLGQCFTKTLFTQRELEVGNEVIFYNQGLMFTSVENKIKSADIMSKVGVLTDNQIGAIFGYPPFEGGDVRHMSLNFINRDIADTYQLSKGRGKEKADGGKE